MTHPVDDYLEGRIGRSELTPSDQRAADAAARAISHVRAIVEVREAPDVRRSVMDRIAESTVAQPVSGRGWPAWLAALWTPRDVSVRVRPVYGVFAAIAVAVLIGWSPFERSLSGPSAGDSRDPQLFVQFRLQAPEAMTVRLAGTFTNWQPRYELHESAPGIWTITLPLTPGVHDYVFVVNGEQWVPDPHAPQIDDGFGGTNSRLALLVPDTSRS
jgi:hypothetical protein